MFGTTATLVRTDGVTYDANRNITKYGNVMYAYDGLNRLVRENNPTLDKTFTWCYDIGGSLICLSLRKLAFSTSIAESHYPTINKQ